jgi:hypothetical protein
MEHVGKIATAWTHYAAVADAARASGQKDREDFAAARAEALRPRLPRLVVEVSAEAREVEGLVVERDEVLLGEAQWGVAVPVDPGTHGVSAKGRGKKRWQFSVSATEGGTVTVTVPALEAEVVPDTRPHRESASRNARDMPAPRDDGTSQRIAGVAIGVAGLVGIGIGSVFGVRAVVKLNESNADGHCDAANTCDATGMGLREEMATAGIISNVAFIAGAAALGAGALVFFTAPAGPDGGSGRAGIALGMNRVNLVGRW